jgi:apolipoprotein N-acyltransferase
VATPPPLSLLLLFAAAGGGSYALAFPPFSLPGAAFVALAPLFVLVSALTPRRAALAGLVWTTGATLALGYWLPGTIARFFEAPVAFGWLALLGLAWLPAGVPIAACSAWAAWAARRGALGPLALGAAFGLTELARTYAWPPLPYAPLGSAALPEALVQSADALGVFGVGMLVAGANAVLAILFAPALRTRRGAAEAVLVGAALALALCLGQSRLAAPTEGGRALRVAAVQPGIALRLAAPEAAEAATRHVAEAATRHAVALEDTRALVGAGHDLVVWPEHAVGFYLRERTAERDALFALSRSLSADLLLGGPHYRYAEPEPHYFASAFLLGAGELRGRHDKTQLVPLAEIAYAAGENIRPLAGAHARVGALVCAELLFPGVARALARGGAEILANPSNDAWLVPAAGDHMLRLAALRAIENRRPLVRATPTGVSAVIDAHGRVVARAPDGARAVIEAAVVPGHGITLTQRFGDWPAWLAAFTVGFVTFVRRRTHA